MNKEDFVVGKWYVSSKWSCFRFAKFKKINLSGYFVYSEKLYLEGKYEQTEDSTTTDHQDWNTFREVPIEELRKYLPSDHPDLQEKKKEFVKGLWYKRDTGTYVKFDHLSGAIFVASEHIDRSGKYYNVEGNYGEITEKTNTYTLIDISEIQQYLPENHPDKIKVNQTSNMFKKDDYIVTLKIVGNSATQTKCGRDNYCFKQRTNDKFLQPCIDLEGSTTNGDDSLTFSKDKDLQYWRYATKAEIQEYNRLGKPYDISSLKQSININKLEIGKYYYVEWNGGINYIFLYNGTSRDSCISITDLKFHRNNCDFDNSSNQKFLRLANQEEIQWLDECIRLDRFVPKDQVKQLTTYIKGNWYEIKNNASVSTRNICINLVKCSEDSTDSTSIKGICSINISNINGIAKGYNNTTSSFSDIFESRLLKPEDPFIQAYLPDSHIDKEPAYKDATEFILKEGLEAFKEGISSSIYVIGADPYKKQKPQISIKTDSEISIKIPVRKQVTI
jgi:hypothetical protein